MILNRHQKSWSGIGKPFEIYRIFIRLATEKLFQKIELRDEFSNWRDVTIGR